MDEVIIIDQAYKYDVDEILVGGVGYVRLMTMREYSRKPPDTGCLIRVESEGENTKYPYRHRLAAKSIKNLNDTEKFATTCKPWLDLNMQGVVPLLAITQFGKEKLALMPRYAGSLRTLMSGDQSPKDMLEAFSYVISSLSKCYSEYGIVHQAIKPENILYCYSNQNLVLELSDWGIASLQADMLPVAEPATFEAYARYGMFPYLAPERFDNYLSDIRGDIFSLGMIFFEIITGSLPYEAGKNIQEQLVSGEYYEKALNILSEFPEEKISNIILKMVNPAFDERMQDYQEIFIIVNSA